MSRTTHKCLLTRLLTASVFGFASSAFGQCPPTYQVDVIEPPSCGIVTAQIGMSDMSETGEMCGGRGCSGGNSGGPVAWWGAMPLVDIPMPFSYPLGQGYGLNSRQQVVGSMRAASGNTNPKGFLYNNGQLTPLEPNFGDDAAEAFAISDSGYTVGYSRGTSAMYASFWPAGSVFPTRMLLPVGPNSIANDITGQLACGWMGQGGTGAKRAFIHDLKTGQTTDVGVPLPSIFNAEANAVNSHSNACGWGFEPCVPTCGGRRGFFWSDGVGYDLGALPNYPRCTANDLNDFNMVIGLCSMAQGASRAFVWQDGVMHKLDQLIPLELNIILNNATGINNAGQIAAHGFINGTGANVAVRLNSIPPVIGDVNCDRIVNVADILGVINVWGECPPQFTAPCNADFNNDQRVGVPDLLYVINHWSQ